MRVHSVRQIVDVFGGAREAGLVLGASAQKVNNWRVSKSIPPSYFPAHRKALRERGIEAPRHLWRCGHCGAIAADAAE